jgi:hypothetical protein
MVGQEEKFSLLLFEIFIFVLLTSQRTNSKGCLKRIQGLAEQKISLKNQISWVVKLKIVQIVM